MLFDIINFDKYWAQYTYNLSFNERRYRIMKKISTQKSKTIIGGTTYKCPYCSFKSTKYIDVKRHAKAWHNVTL